VGAPGSAQGRAGRQIELTPYHAPDQSYLIRDDARPREPQTCSCVGAQAVFFGGALLRYREEEPALDPEIAAGSGARWPFSYPEIEPWYHQTERLLDLAGPEVPGPTAPPRSGPFPQSLPPLTPVAGRLACARRDLGFIPSRLPLAVNHRRGATACSECRTCDSYACAIAAPTRSCSLAARWHLLT
jgi:choline dehydrogenase-like flavoprotein